MQMFLPDGSQTKKSLSTIPVFPCTFRKVENIQESEISFSSEAVIKFPLVLYGPWENTAEKPWFDFAA